MVTRISAEEREGQRQLALVDEAQGLFLSLTFCAVLVFRQKRFDSVEWKPPSQYYHPRSIDLCPAGLDRWTGRKRSALNGNCAMSRAIADLSRKKRNKRMETSHLLAFIAPIWVSLKRESLSSSRFHLSCAFLLFFFLVEVFCSNTEVVIQHH